MELKPSEVVKAVVGVLDALKIPYMVGGSFASIAYGTHRTTEDVDLVVDLDASQVDELTDALKSAFYIDGDAVREALRRRSMFNAIHYETSFKVDFHLRKGDAYDKAQFGRRRVMTLDEAGDCQAMVASAEDTVVKKLQWYKMGQCISERQWRDVIGVMKVQGERLDLDYMRRWAEPLGIGDLLEEALTEAGL